METKKAGEQPKEKEVQEYKIKHVSTDVESGIVVYDTDAPDKTEFTLTIDGALVKGKSEGGQIWFRTDEPISESAFIYIK